MEEAGTYLCAGEVVLPCEVCRISVQHRLAINAVDLVGPMELEVSRLLDDSQVLVHDCSALWS